MKLKEGLKFLAIFQSVSDTKLPKIQGSNMETTSQREMDTLLGKVTLSKMFISLLLVPYEERKESASCFM